MQNFIDNNFNYSWYTVDHFSLCNVIYWWKMPYFSKVAGPHRHAWGAPGSWPMLRPYLQLAHGAQESTSTVIYRYSVTTLLLETELFGGSLLGWVILVETEQNITNMLSINSQLVKPDGKLSWGSLDKY